MDGKANVIVTDGFTGNIALKTARVQLISLLKNLRINDFKFLGKVSSLINIKNLNKIKKKLDPRLYNGAILIGLIHLLLKVTDQQITLVSTFLNVCIKIVKNNLIQKIKENIIK